jgi:hypothetical protein
MKATFSLIRSNFFCFWKYNKQDRFGFSYFINTIKQIDRIFNYYNLLLLDYSIKQNSIYIYLLLFNLIKKKQVFTALFYKTNFYLYKYIRILYLFSYFYNILIQIFYIFKKKLTFFYFIFLLYSKKQIKIFSLFYLQCFFNKKLLFVTKKVQKSTLKFILLKNNFTQFSILLNYELNKKLIFSKKLILKNVFSIYSLININWKYFSIDLKKNIKQNCDKNILNFNLNVRTLIYISYFAELFKNSFVLLNYLFFLIYTQKQAFVQNILKVLNFFQNNLYWLLYYNFIHFFGLKLFLSGKFTNSMRKARHSFTYGVVSSRLSQFISFSSKYFVIRAGLINFKLWILF